MEAKTAPVLTHKNSDKSVYITVQAPQKSRLGMFGCFWEDTFEVSSDLNYCDFLAALAPWTSNEQLGYVTWLVHFFSVMNLL